MNTTSLNESRIIKLSKAVPASQNNWKNYISTCAGNVSSLTESKARDGAVSEFVQKIASNLIKGNLSPVGNADYVSFLSSKAGSMGVSALGETFNVDPEVELVANHDWRLGTIKNDYEGVLDSNKTLSKFLSGDSGFVSGIKHMFDGAAIATSATGSNKSLYNYSTQTWWKNLKGWTGTDPISVQFTFDFAIGQYGLWNAKKEVVLPMLNLIAMFCPALIADGSMIGPTATPSGMLYSVISDTILGATDVVEDLAKGNTEGFTSLVESAADWVKDTFKSGSKSDDPENRGNSITSVLNGVASLLGGITAEVAQTVSDKLLTVLKNSTYDVQIGNFMSISNCICTGINSITFSNKVDEFGYPISGSVTLVLQGVIPPTFSGTRADLVTLRFGGF